ncbi:hypothetical protein AVEN_274452-1 [Araneus ventricosus]|uniref:Fibronectin type-III domain-containing protein n=1 Tax=Araneus ventricosus TaxID=182803 RepID=A0A4Y2F3E1_ARAVE|nr:hypothetical protein AVEN_274452-1 [Araneus ventricosus]
MRNCLVTNHTTDSLLIQCEPGYDGGLPQTFHLEIYSSTNEHLRGNMTSEDSPTFLVQDLLTGTSFILVLYAANAKGRSNSVALVASTLRPAERHTAEEDESILSPMIGILIGIVAAFVILSIVIAIIVRLRTHEKHKDPAKRTHANLKNSLHLLSGPSAQEIQQVYNSAFNDRCWPWPPESAGLSRTNARVGKSANLLLFKKLEEVSVLAQRTEIPRRTNEIRSYLHTLLHGMTSGFAGIGFLMAAGIVSSSDAYLQFFCYHSQSQPSIIRKHPSMLSGVVLVGGRPERGSSSTSSFPSLKRLPSGKVSALGPEGSRFETRFH